MVPHSRIHGIGRWSRLQCDVGVTTRPQAHKDTFDPWSGAHEIKHRLADLCWPIDRACIDVAKGCHSLAKNRGLLDAYYAGAVDVMMLRQEQERLRRQIGDVEARLRHVDATLAQWQEILGIALRFAENCGAAYHVANERTRALYNRAVFETLIIRDGRIAEPLYAAPFGIVFGATEFEQGSLELLTSHNPNRTPILEGGCICIGDVGRMGGQRLSGSCATSDQQTSKAWFASRLLRTARTLR